MAEPKQEFSPEDLAHLLRSEDTEYTEGDLTPDQLRRLAEMNREIPEDAIQEEKKRLDALVETMDINAEQKKELIHRVAFLFSATIFETAFMTLYLVGNSNSTLELAVIADYSPAMAIALILFISAIGPLTTLKASGYGEFKDRLQETENNLMGFAELLHGDMLSPKAAFRQLANDAHRHRVKKRAEQLALNIKYAKPKRENGDGT